MEYITRWQFWLAVIVVTFIAHIVFSKFAPLSMSSVGSTS